LCVVDDDDDDDDGVWSGEARHRLLEKTETHSGSYRLLQCHMLSVYCAREGHLLDATQTST